MSPTMANLGAAMRSILRVGTPPNIATLLIMYSDLLAHQPRSGGAFLLPCIDTVQGFYFALQRISHAQAFTAAFIPSMQFYTTKTSKSFTGLYSGFSVDLPHSSARNTAATQAAYAPLAPRRTLYSSAQPPYYNNVYKGATDRRTYKPGGAVQRQGRGAEPLAACRRFSFRAFAR